MGLFSSVFRLIKGKALPIVAGISLLGGLFGRKKNRIVYTGPAANPVTPERIYRLKRQAATMGMDWKRLFRHNVGSKVPIPKWAEYNSLSEMRKAYYQSQRQNVPSRPQYISKQQAFVATHGQYHPQPVPRPVYRPAPKPQPSPYQQYLENYKKQLQQYQQQVAKQQSQISSLMNQISNLNKSLLEAQKAKATAPTMIGGSLLDTNPYNNLMSENYFSANVPSYTVGGQSPQLYSYYLQNYYAPTPYGITWF